MIGWKVELKYILAVAGGIAVVIVVVILVVGG
jgi:hypothetical protein